MLRCVSIGLPWMGRGLGRRWYKRGGEGEIVPIWKEEDSIMEQQKISKHILITGATTGIGLETAQQLCQLGHNVCITAREEEKAVKAEQLIRDRTPSALISHILLELSSFESVDNALAETRNMEPFDIVILNAGMMFPDQPATENGIESAFQVNYLAHYWLAKGLIAQKLEGHHLHFVMLSSVLIKCCKWPIWAVPRDEQLWSKTFGPQKKSAMREYALSKFALTLLASEISEHDEVSATAVNPGNSVTGMTRNMTPWMKKVLSVFKYTLISTEAAASNVIRGALNPLPKGRFYQQSKEASLPKHLTEESAVHALLSLSRGQLQKAGVRDSL